MYSNRKEESLAIFMMTMPSMIMGGLLFGIYTWNLIKTDRSKCEKIIECDDFYLKSKHLSPNAWVVLSKQVYKEWQLVSHWHL